MVLRGGVNTLDDEECIGTDREDILRLVRHHAQAALLTTRRVCGDEHLRTAHALVAHVLASVLVAVNLPSETYSEEQDRYALFKQALLEMQQVAVLMVSHCVVAKQ